MITKFGLVLALAVLATILMAGVFGAVGIEDSFGIAVQALSTLALVAVTWRYVQLTGKLVDSQNKSLQQAMESEEKRTREAERKMREQTLRQVWRESMKVSYSLGNFAEDVSCLRDASLSGTDLTEKVEAIRAEAEAKFSPLADVFLANAPDLPEEFERAAWEATSMLTRLNTELSAVSTALMEEVISSLQEGRDFDVREAEKVYSARHRPRLTGKPEWSEICDGRALRAARKVLGEFELQAYARLRPDSGDS